MCQLSIPESPLASPDRKASGAKWLGLVLCVRAQPQHHFPGAGLLPACPAVPSIVDSGACGGSFSTGKEKHCWLSPSSCLVASLGVGSLYSHLQGGTQPCVRKQGRSFQFLWFQWYSYAAELENDKKTPNQHLKEKLFHHTQLLFPAPDDLSSLPQGCSSIPWCWPHGLP